MTKILTIEDEEAIRNDICDLLALEGYQPIAAKNGRIGLQAIRDHAPDLVICDILMPELDGYGVLRTLRQEASYADLPFLFLSAKTSAEDARLGLDLGANAYLSKPFTPRELLQTVRDLLGQTPDHTPDRRDQD